jgi:hypothetical protein
MLLRPHGKRFYHIITAAGATFLAFSPHPGTINGMSRTAYSLLAMMAALVAVPLYSVEVGEKPEEAGTRVALPGDTKLQLAIEEKKIVATFIDAEGKVIESPAESMVLVVDQQGHKNDEIRTLMNSADKIRLVSSRTLFPPYDFRARVIIRFTDGTTRTFPYLSLDLAKKSE